MKFLFHAMFIAAMFIVALGIVHSAIDQDCKVVAVDESPGRTMNAALFASTDKAIVDQYMPTGNALASVSSFVLFAGKDIVLFDAGNNGDDWYQKLVDIGVKPESVALILLTHYHGDHIGGLLKGNDRRFPNAKVLSSAPEYKAGQQQLPTKNIQSAYGENFATFNFDDVVFENSSAKVVAMDASGHTPGHSVFLIEPKKEDRERILILGDLLHAAVLQFPVPEACASYDNDREKAIAARKRILDFAARENILVGGMHFPPPSLGTVKKENDGYSFELKE